ncbi:MAG: fatty acid desaturase family protein [Bacteroidia bacterium]
MSKVSFNNKQSPFFDSVKEKVERYFRENNIRQTGNFKLFSKSLILFPIAIFFYVALVFFSPGIILSVFFCILFGFTLSIIGFNVMHDGAHGCYSRLKWLNNLSSHSLSVMGGSTFMWKIKHNIMHHSFTNIDGVDDDLNNRPFFRITQNDPKYKVHKYQYIYWVVLYMLSYPSWVFVQDFIKYFSHKISDTKIRKMSFTEHLKFWGTKLSYFSVFIVIPMFTAGVINTIVGYLILAFSCGFAISLVFQLAHIVGQAEFPNPESDTNKIEEEWAVHQVKTTVNFATKNKFISWIVGGLNFQVEHHLFPKVSHVHYPQLSKIVKETCLQFDIKYNEYPTMLSAIRAHVLHLKLMGSM